MKSVDMDRSGVLQLLDESNVDHGDSRDEMVCGDKHLPVGYVDCILRSEREQGTCGCVS